MVEKQLKFRRPYSTVLRKPATPLKPFNSYKPGPNPNDDKGKGKDVAKDLPKSKKKCFKCHGCGHFQADCPNRRVLTIREIKELNHMEVEEDEEEDS